MNASGAERLPIRTICSLTGVNPVTLRAWERRYGLVQPQRTPKGHRLYSHRDVERIRRTQALLERGVSISQVRGLLDVEAGAAAAADTAGPWRTYQERMAAAVARFDELELDEVYDEALSIHPIETVTHRLTLPLLARLGARWQDLAGAVAEEHFFATYLRSKLGARLQQRMRYAMGPRIVAACAPGEQHEIGLLLFALEARAAGLRPVLLGADTPLADIAIAQQHSGSAAIVISSSVEPSRGFLERELPILVRQATGPVFIGGPTALRHGPAIHTAGAIALGTELENGVRRIVATLAGREPGQ